MNKKIVRFDDSKNIVKILYVWLYAYQNARKSKWLEMARDRDRFNARIIKLSYIIEPILVSKLKQINLKK